MVQITLIQSVGWIAAAIILQGPSSYTSTGINFIITHGQYLTSEKEQVFSPSSYQETFF